MDYLALFLSLPTKAASERTKFWRALKATGSAPLRDGVYLLPSGDSFAQTFAELAQQAIAVGGTADIFALNATQPTQETWIRQLFSRDQDYADLEGDMGALRREIAQLDFAAGNRRYQVLTRRYEQILATDFYAGTKAASTKSLLDELGDSLRRYWSPDEPTSATADIIPCNPADYQGRIWATRARPWVDRLASAWLIQRFIDPTATFQWLASPEDCLPDWLGFDFDGATFTHIGEKVTFETLLASFGLEANPSLRWMADLVHCLDVGGFTLAEAPGVEAMLAGLRTSEPDDDALLAAAGRLFDWLLENHKHRKP